MIEKRYFNKDKKRAKGFSSPDFDVRYTISEDKKTITKKYYYNKTYLKTCSNIGLNLIKEIVDEYHSDGKISQSSTKFMDGSIIVQSYDYYKTLSVIYYRKKNEEDPGRIFKTCYESISDNIKTVSEMEYNEDGMKKECRTITIYKDETLKEELYKIDCNTMGEEIYTFLRIEDVVNNRTNITPSQKPRD